ncbi:MAG: VCBS repeat-containing protein [Ignavibacteriae bacterium]|nr:VCBS repeat-containing protein [Ignavibacteriota bacterium]
MNDRYFFVVCYLTIFLVLCAFNLNAQPNVVDVTPAKNALSVSKASNITAVFDMPMNISTFNANNIIVCGVQSGRHTGTITPQGNNAFTFNLDSNFMPGEIVNVTLTINILSATGGNLTNGYHWSFTIQNSVSTGMFAAKVDYATSNPMSVFVNDVNRNGDGDLAVANFNSSTVSILKNNGYGTFTNDTDYITGGPPRSVFINDVDGNGYGDLVAASYESNTVSVLKNKGDGKFYPKTDYPAGGSPRSVFISDLDGDGDGDLAVANDAHGTVSILKNNGDGTFSAPVPYPTRLGSSSVFISDIDGDGDGDLAVANQDVDVVSILKNNGDGTFATKVDYSTGSNPNSVFISDLDGDGDGDLVVANNNSIVSVRKNNGYGIFPDSTRVDYLTAGGSTFVFIGDVDGDGDGDIVTSNSSSSNVSVLKNNGNGTFASRVNYSTGINPYAVFISDIDGDGDGDLVVANFSSNTVSILKNLNYGSISGTKFNDLNGNGIKDGSDGVLEGWRIYLTGSFSDSTFTDSLGNYSFDSLMPGTYTITEEQRAGWLQTFPPLGLYTITLDGDKDTTGLDFGNKLQTFTIIASTIGGGSITPTDTVSITYGANRQFTFTPNSGYHIDSVLVDGLRVDSLLSYTFSNVTTNHTITAYFSLLVGSISGIKFEDINGNGIKDGSDGVLNGWSIYLQGTTSETTLTDINGNYSFTNLQTGTYSICEIQRPGWKQTKPPASRCYSITLIAGQDTSGFVFGNYRVGSVCGYVFVDHDSDGVRDLYIDDLKKNMDIILKGITTPPETLATDANGAFTFNSVVPDTYTIKQVPKVNWRQTKPAGGASYTVIITPGLDTCGFAFGNFYVPDTTKYRTFQRIDYNVIGSTKPRGKTQIRKPNAGDVRDSVYLKRGFGLDTPIDSGYLRVGVRRYDSTDCYGWFFFPWDSIREKGQRKYGYHRASVAKYQFPKPWKKEPKTNYFWWRGEIRTSSQFANAANHFAFELLTLKTNVAASDLGITPNGLGDLIFDRDIGPDTIFNGMTIRQIIARSDTSLTMGIIHCPSLPVDTVIPIGHLIILDSVVSRLNRDMWKALDKKKFTDSISTSPLRFKGAVALYKIPYLKRHSSTVTMLTKFKPIIVQTEMPLEFQLEQNYPNPFNPSTVIRYQVSVNSLVTLKIYDLLGREIATLVNNELMEEGDYDMEFDASEFASGVYFYRLTATGVDEHSTTFTDVKKMLLVR